MNYSLTPIAYIQSPFKEKFAVPRQPGLAPSALSSIVLIDDANNEDAVRGLEQFSHLWLLFLFDKNLDKGWSPTVRPPRLGGNKRVGVFASRATFRPNAIGMSVVGFRQVRKEQGNIIIDVASADLVDGTPIIDIKPYIPYCDNITDAAGGYGAEQPSTFEVIFSEQAIAVLEQQKDSAYKKQVIREVLAQDPRPAYKKGKTDNKEYAVHLFDLNVFFNVKHQLITLFKIQVIGDN